MNDELEWLCKEAIAFCLKALRILMEGLNNATRYPLPKSRFDLGTSLIQTGVPTTSARRLMSHKTERREGMMESGKVCLSYYVVQDGLFPKKI
jgi:hypothetical protein